MHENNAKVRDTPKLSRSRRDCNQAGCSVTRRAEPVACAWQVLQQRDVEEAEMGLSG
jgi:hypothetical protein